MILISENGKQNIDNILRKAVENEKIPAAAFGVTDIDGVIYSGGAGNKVPGDLSSGEVDVNTNFWICSQTKLLTSIAALQLIERGALSLSTPVSTILLELANPIVLDNPQIDCATFKPANNAITVLHLLNHTSGLFYGVKHPKTSKGAGDPYEATYEDEGSAVERFFQVLKGDYPGVPLSCDPGTNFAYGYSTDALGFVIERVTGQTLEHYFEENIFKPLGMTSSSFYVTPEIEKNSLRLYFRQEDGKAVPLIDQIKIFPRESTKVHIRLGGDGLTSSLSDYMTLLRHLLQINAGTAKNPILTPQSSASLLTAPSLPPSALQSLNEFRLSTDSQFTLGLCLNTMDRPGKRRKGSVTWGGWAGTQFFLDLETGIGVVYGVQVLVKDGIDMGGLLLWRDLEEALYKSMVQDE